MGRSRGGPWSHPLTTLDAHSASSFGTGPAAATGRRLLDSLTLRNWLRGIFWTWAIVTICLGLYWFDKYQGFFEFEARRLSDYRMFKNPTTTPMRIFGIPHFVIAVLFLLTSRRMKQRRNQVLFAGLTVLGVGLCWLFRQAGGHLSPFAVFIFYFYFLIHGFRDDAHFYRTYGDMPREGAEAHDRIVLVLQCLLIGLLFSLFWPTYAHVAATDYRRADPILGSFFPASWPFVLKLGSMFLPMAGVAAVALHRIARRMPGGWAGLWRSHQPLLVVYLLSLAVLVAAMLGGPGAFDVWVLNHFVVWFLFALYLMRRFPPKEPVKGAWAWVRTNRRGFMVLHFGLAAVVAGLMAVSVYAFGQRETPLDWIVGKESFFYWTILHVTWSFVPR
jgi:hypothetical protein